ncbi:MAG TPA: hypothetical protein VK191_11640 [Symbiobacteriaceae bacterium]|nr:hypothetical protein [Symbiobacteriaceae bacterium]
MRAPDWIVALLLTLLTGGVLLSPQPVLPEHLAFTVAQRAPQGPPVATDRAVVSVYATWQWSIDPPTGGQDYLLVVAESEGWVPTDAWNRLEPGLIEGLGIHGQAWAFPVKPARVGEQQVQLRPTGQTWSTELPLRVYYLHRGPWGSGLVGSTWLREVSTTIPVPRLEANRAGPAGGALSGEGAFRRTASL